MNEKNNCLHSIPFAPQSGSIQTNTHVMRYDRHLESLLAVIHVLYMKSACREFKAQCCKTMYGIMNEC